MIHMASEPFPTAQRGEAPELERGVYTLRELGRRAGELATLSARAGKPFSCVVFAPEVGAGPAGSGLAPAAPDLPDRFTYVLRTKTRKKDALGRIERTVFALLAPETPPEGIPVFARRLQREVALAPWDPSVFVGPMIRAGYAGVDNPAVTPVMGFELLVRATDAYRVAVEDPDGPWLRRAS